MTTFNRWYKINRGVLNYLYNKLFIISKSYGVNLIDSQETFDNYIDMMYNLSNKEVIDKRLYPEFFDLKFNSNGFQNYKIMD